MREIDESKTDQRKVFEFFLDAAKDQEKIVNLQAKVPKRKPLDLRQAAFYLKCIFSTVKRSF